MKTKTGRKGLGEVNGFASRLGMSGQRLGSYAVRLPNSQAQALATLLKGSPDEEQGFILATTAENFDRIRVLASPPPLYQRRAARYHARSDAFRVAGTPRSCNISLPSGGARLVREQLEKAIADAQEWLELRARIVRQTPDEGARYLIEFVPDVEIRNAGDGPFGRAGAALSTQVWPADDFSDWESGRE